MVTAEQSLDDGPRSEGSALLRRPQRRGAPPAEMSVCEGSTGMCVMQGARAQPTAHGGWRIMTVSFRKVSQAGSPERALPSEGSDNGALPHPVLPRDIRGARPALEMDRVAAGNSIAAGLKHFAVISDPAGSGIARRTAALSALLSYGSSRKAGQERWLIRVSGNPHPMPDPAHGNLERQHGPKS